MWEAARRAEALDLSGVRPGHQELQGDGRLPRPGGTLHEVQAVAGEPAAQDIVEAINAGSGPGQDGIWRAHGIDPGNILARSADTPLPQNAGQYSPP